MDKGTQCFVMGHPGCHQAYLLLLLLTVSGHPSWPHAGEGKVGSSPLLLLLLLFQPFPWADEMWQSGA